MDIRDDSDYAKAKIMGCAPSIDDYGNAVSLPESINIIITPNIKSIENLYIKENHNLTFLGNNDIEIPLLMCDSIIIKNPKLEKYIDDYKFQANTITLAYKGIQPNILYKIYDSYRKNITFRIRTSYILDNSLDKKEVYNILKNILLNKSTLKDKENKLNITVAKLRIIRTVYDTYKDKQILKIDKNYITEVRLNFDEVLHSINKNSYIVNTDLCELIDYLSTGD